MLYFCPVFLKPTLSSIVMVFVLRLTNSPYICTLLVYFSCPVIPMSIFSLVCSMSHGFLQLYLLPVYIPLSYAVLHKFITHIRHHRLNTFHTNTLQHIQYSTTYTILILPSGLYRTYSIVSSAQTSLLYDHIGPPDYY